LASGVPGRTGRQLALLDQQHILAPFFGQVIEQADTHDSATDDYDLRMRINDNLLVRPCEPI
jgi:hypothetical protein